MENNKEIMLRSGIQYHWKNNNYKSFDNFLKFIFQKKKNY